MKFTIMGLEPRGEWDRLDAAEMHRRVGHHQQKLDELAMTRLHSGPPGLIFASFGLGAESEVVTVRRERGRHACIDGPFPETKEVIGGFDIIEFASHQDAIAWSTSMQRHPSHVSEIRPIREFWWISGIVDRARMESLGRLPHTPERTQSAVAAAVFMLTSVEDAPAMGRPSDGERKQREAEQQLVVAQYVKQRSTVDHQPGMWVGVRLSTSAQATTIRWTGGTPTLSDGVVSDTKDVISGFNIVACASQEEAIAWAQKLATHDGEVIEVRPVRGSWWIYHE